MKTEEEMRRFVGKGEMTLGHDMRANSDEKGHVVASHRGETGR